MEFMSLMASIGVDIAKFKRDLTDAQKAAKTFQRRPEMQGMSLDVEAKLDTEELDDNLDELKDELDDIQEDFEIEGTADIDTSDYESGVSGMESLADSADVDVDGEATMDDSDYTDSLDGLILLAGNSDVDVDGEATLATDGYDTSITSVETSASGADADVDGTASLDITGFDSAVTNAVSRAGDLDDAVDEITTSSGEADTALGGIGSDTDYSGAIGRLDGIKQGLTNIITTAVNAAKAIADVAIDSSTWADDLITESQQYGIDTTTLQQMRYASRFIDTEVGTIEGATQRLTKNLDSIQSGTGDLAEKWATLVEASGNSLSMFDAEGELRPTLDIFWDIVDALGEIENPTERNQIAMDLLGRNVAELNPLITQGTKKYKEFMEVAPTLGEDNVFVLGKLNDAYQDLESQIEVTKLEMLSELAPSITVATEALAEFVKEFRKFIETEKGQAALQQFNDAITSLVLSLTSEENISSIFSALSETVSAISKGLEWIADDPDSIIDAFKGIGDAIIGITVADSVLKFMTLLSNGAILKSLGGLGAGKGLATAGAAAGGGEAAAAAAGGGSIWASKLAVLGTPAVAAPLTGIGLGIAGGIALDKYGTQRDFGSYNEMIAEADQVIAQAQAGSQYVSRLGELFEAIRPEGDDWDVETASQAFDVINEHMGELTDVLGDLEQYGWDKEWTTDNLGTNVIDIASAAGKIMTALADGIENGETGEALETEVTDGITEGSEAGADAMLDVLGTASETLATQLHTDLQGAMDSLKLPTFSVTVDHGMNTFPSRFNASAMDSGAILHGLTPFGIDSNGVVQYAGEAGAEAVVGVNSLNEMIQRSVNAAMARVQTVRQPVSVQLVLDSGELLGAVDLGLNDRASWRGGGHA